MTDKEQKQAAKEFAEFWKDKGYEKGQSQTYWLQLLSQVLGVDKPEEFIEFEDQVHIDKSTGFIDGYIPSTKILIEQKSIEKDLRKAIRQSDGSLLNPFQQAKKYIAELPVSKHPKYVITCNFKSFLIYNMENPNGEPEEILLENLEKEYYRLSFIVDSENEHLKKEMEISIKAGDLVGELYELFLKQYQDPDDMESLKSLNKLCVRLVFCLYAEDAGLFGKKNMFHDFLAKFDVVQIRTKLIELFKVLDTPLDKRDKYLEDDLAQFPYVNGGLFADEDIEIPRFTEEIKNVLLAKASDDFDWSEISPTIFGAVFESTLNPETRRSGGMHYTSIENIHKVIDPLFLDELKEELKEIKQISVIKTKKKKLEEFQDKLASLKFLDPACGSGNFLTETYLSLRKLENEVIFELTGGQIGFGDEEFSPIKVSIGQFYGIEINDFAVTVAKTALWIAESQMMKKTEEIIHMNIDFLPLKAYANITEANALRIDWNDVVEKNELNYIMGNPPFIGARLMNETQKEDIANIFKGVKNAGNIDYVGCWYKKASLYIKDTNIEVAFVSTNSICQGEQTTILWKSILENGIYINFAYKTFRWDSEASLKAHVHCIIVGFSYVNRKDKFIYENEKFTKVDIINAYLVNAPILFLESRKKPICNVPTMDFGSMPNDGGLLSDYTEEQKNDLIKQYPETANLFKRFIGATEFLHNKKRYCIWLKDIEPQQIKNCKCIYDIVEQVRKMRLSSNREATKKLADMPALFGEIRQPDTNYLVFPRHSSQNRRYVPIGYMESNIICGDANLLIPSASLYNFGVLMSNVHNSWMRVFAGRIKSDYRYSASIVYNTFPWPTPTDKQKEKIEKTAQIILDARAKYPNSSLADLYDELTMPVELRKAHQENDKAVMEAYGFDWKKMTESDCVAELMKMYEKLNTK
jgi:type I restriction-modification system DNA methylase subunit